VSYYDALADAEWLGKELYTEMQWEKACRGKQGWLYPWGNEYEAKHCNLYDESNGLLCEVNRYEGGKSPYGCFDLIGNVMEWTGTTVLTHNKRKAFIVKGASAISSPKFALSYLRHYCYRPKQSSYYIGFRCVKKA